MVTLCDRDSGAVLGDISDAEFRFLDDRLEHESSGDTDYYINRDLLDVLAGRGIPQRLLDFLRQSLGDRDEMEVRCAGATKDNPDPDPFRQKVLRLEDEELLNIARESDQYRPEVLSIAMEEIARRGLSVESATAEDTPIPMGRLFNQAGEAGIGLAGEEPAAYEAAGITIVCPHCKSSQFHSHNALLNTRGLTFLRLDWLNRGATVLICSDCGLIQWFSEPPTRQ